MPITPRAGETSPMGMSPELAKVAIALGVIGMAVAMLLLRDRLRRRGTAARQCPQCDAEMDAEESMCPQCGHSVKPKPTGRKKSIPQIKLDPLASPSARR